MGMVDRLRWYEGIVEKGRGAYQGGVGRVGIEIWAAGDEAAVDHWVLWRVPYIATASVSGLLRLQSKDRNKDGSGAVFERTNI